MTKRFITTFIEKSNLIKSNINKYLYNSVILTTSSLCVYNLHKQNNLYRDNDTLKIILQKNADDIIILNKQNIELQQQLNEKITLLTQYNNDTKLQQNELKTIIELNDEKNRTIIGNIVINDLHQSIINILFTSVFWLNFWIR